MKKNLYIQLEKLASDITAESNVNTNEDLKDVSEELTKKSRIHIHPCCLAVVHKKNAENIYITLGIDTIKFVGFQYNLITGKIHDIKLFNESFLPGWLKKSDDMKVFEKNFITADDYSITLDVMTDIIMKRYRRIYFNGVSHLIAVQTINDDDSLLEKNICSFLELIRPVDKVYFPDYCITEKNTMKRMLEFIKKTHDICSVDLKIQTDSETYSWHKEYLTSDMADEYAEECIQEFYSKPTASSYGKAVVKIISTNILTGKSITASEELYY